MDALPATTIGTAKIRCGAVGVQGAGSGEQGAGSRERGAENGRRDRRVNATGVTCGAGAPRSTKDVASLRTH
ncbi:MAG: hypothetical protein JSW71_03925 [Gemmatimonadota bacterium]|nr:MAG: hypothetical protein JSW71_03925 [Gemmatimonadota bacterium]